MDIESSHEEQPVEVSDAASHATELLPPESSEEISPVKRPISRARPSRDEEERKPNTISPITVEKLVSSYKAINEVELTLNAL